MKLIEVATGWMNFIQSSPEIKQMMDYRLGICDECPYKSQIGTTAAKILQSINNESSIYFCSSCKCPLATKTAAPMAVCPLKKWGVWIKPQI